jgi:hypothetical protein
MIDTSLRQLLEGPPQEVNTSQTSRITANKIEVNFVSALFV